MRTPADSIVKFHELLLVIDLTKPPRQHLGHFIARS